MRKSFGGGKNLNKLMKQAQKMQSDMAKAQEELGSKTVEVVVGGGAIKAVVNGHKQLQELVIQPDVVDPDDVEMLQDMLIAAVNEAIEKAEKMAQDAMGKITGGMPGLF